MIRDIEWFFSKALPQGISALVESSPDRRFGHYATGVALRLAKNLKRPPLEVAEELVRKIRAADHSGFFEKIEIAPPGFINFWLSTTTLSREFELLLRRKEKYGQSSVGRGRKVIVEYSDPNIAKRMHVGHLRSTIIGDAIANIHEFLGYPVLRWNYIGDWGTQFGKMIAAYKLWGKKEEIKKDSIEALQTLYVRFHDELKTRPELESRGREEFRKLEEGNRENRRLWTWFKKDSLKEFNRIYKILGVRFDTLIGESFYEKMLKPLIEELKTRGLAVESQGSVIIPLEDVKLPPALIQKSDGASLYLTRDITNLQYRVKKFHPAKILYVVGNEQSLHFEQLFAVAGKLDLALPEVAHVKYGLVLGEDAKKLSTREGKTILLEEVITKAIRLARKILEAKNPNLAERTKRRVADCVGIAALKYNDLKENRHSDIVFDWERMLSFDGNSAPYLLYTYARLRSILRKAGYFPWGRPALESRADVEVILKLVHFPEILEKVVLTYFPHHLAEYLYSLAKTVNAFYQNEPVLKAPQALRNQRLHLITAAAAVLKTGLGLLGIKTVEHM